MTACRGISLRSSTGPATGTLTFYALRFTPRGQQKIPPQIGAGSNLPWFHPDSRGASGTTRSRLALTGEPGSGYAPTGPRTGDALTDRLPGGFPSRLLRHGLTAGDPRSLTPRPEVLVLFDVVCSGYPILYREQATGASLAQAGRHAVKRRWPRRGVLVEAAATRSMFLTLTRI